MTVRGSEGMRKNAPDSLTFPKASKTRNSYYATPLETLNLKLGTILLSFYSLVFLSYFPFSGQLVEWEYAFNARVF